LTRAQRESSRELLEAIAKLQTAAKTRYGDAIIEVSLGPDGLRGAVALPGQAEALRRLVGDLWPAARCQLLVLSTRHSRAALYPLAEPMEIWRRRPDQGGPERELTTELLPGDPPAELLAVRGGNYLVKATGEAVGWVAHTARFRFGPTQTLDCPGAAVVPRLGWDPEVVRQTALDLIGRPYVFGGTGGLGVDCSGLTWRAFLTAGVRLPRNSRAQRRTGERVRLAELGATDLICAVHRGPRRTSHVALSLGDGEVVHACSESHQVLRERLADFRTRYQVLTVRRVPGAVGTPR